MEYDSLKISFDEFIESSSQLEKELEENLVASEVKYAGLLKKQSETEGKLSTLLEKYSQSSKEITSMQSELTRLRSRVADLEDKKRSLESSNENLTEKVRILETTESDLLHKLQRAEEDIIFLQNDFEELQTERLESERRLKGELTDIQAELAKVDASGLSPVRGEFMTPEAGKLRDIEPPLLEDEDDKVDNAARDQREQQLLEDIEELELEIEELTEKLAQSEQSNAQLNDEVSRLTDEIIQMHEKHAEELHRTSNDTEASTALQQLLEQRGIEVADLNQKLFESKAAIDDLSGQLTTFSASLSKKESEVVSLQTQSEIIVKQCHECTVHIQQLSDELATKNQEIQDLKSQLISAGGAAAAATAAASTALAEKEAVMQQVAKGSASESAAAAVAAAHAQRVALLECQVAALQESSDSIEIEKKSLAQMLEQSKEEVKNALSTQDQVRAEGHAKVQALADQLRERDQALAQSTEQIEQLSSEITVIKTSLQEAFLRDTTQHQQRSALQQQLQNEVERASAFQRDNLQQQQLIATLEAEARAQAAAAARVTAEAKVLQFVPMPPVPTASPQVRCINYSAQAKRVKFECPLRVLFEHGTMGI